MSTSTQRLTCPDLGDEATTFLERNRSIHARMRTERNMLWSLLAHLEAAGFKVTGVFDGEERVKCSTPLAALQAVFSVDESSIFVKREGDARGHTLAIVLGNDGWEAVSDYSMGPGFDEAMAAFDFDAWDDRPSSFEGTLSANEVGNRYYDDGERGGEDGSSSYRQL